MCKPFKEPRNRFPALRAGTTILFDVPACQATQAGGINSLELIPGLLKRLQIRAQVFTDLFHVGLARTEPNIAIDNILQRHTLGSLSYLEYECQYLSKTYVSTFKSKVSSGQNDRRNNLRIILNHVFKSPQFWMVLKATQFRIGHEVGAGQFRTLFARYRTFAAGQKMRQAPKQNPCMLIAQGGDIKKLDPGPKPHQS